MNLGSPNQGVNPYRAAYPVGLPESGHYRFTISPVATEPSSTSAAKQGG